jgi:hypothetical protein
MSDVWREVPAGVTFDGLTELTREGRSIASVGVGPDVRAALVEAHDGKRAERDRPAM